MKQFQIGQNMFFCYEMMKVNGEKKLKYFLYQATACFLHKPISPKFHLIVSKLGTCSKKHVKDNSKI
jgi:hypothetical protein